MDNKLLIRYFSLLIGLILLMLCWLWWRKKSVFTNAAISAPNLASQTLESTSTKQELSLESLLSLKNTLSTQIQQVSSQISQINTQILKQQSSRLAIGYQRFDLVEHQTSIDLSGVLALGKILDIERNGLSMDEQVEYQVQAPWLILHIPADAGEFISIEYQAHTL